MDAEPVITNATNFVTAIPILDASAAITAFPPEDSPPPAALARPRPPSPAGEGGAGHPAGAASSGSAATGRAVIEPAAAGPASPVPDHVPRPQAKRGCRRVLGRPGRIPPPCRQVRWPPHPPAARHDTSDRPGCRAAIHRSSPGLPRGVGARRLPGRQELAASAVLPRTIRSTSSRTSARVTSSAASTLSRSSGSVLDGRRLNHHCRLVTVRPSSSSMVTPERPENASLTWPAVVTGSLTSLLISPEAR